MPFRTDSAPTTKSQLADFTQLCEEQTGLSFADPQEFHAFSTSEYREFWGLFLEWADPLREGDPEPICSDDRCEDASFFPNLRLSYAENLLRSRSPGDDERIAVIARHGAGPPERIRRGELREQVRTLAGHLRSLGVQAGDRVAAIAPSNAEAIVGGLAAATIGASFSSAAPDMGVAAIVSRFEQLSPKVLMADFRGEDGGASPFAERVEEVAKSLPGLVALVALGGGDQADGISVPVLCLADLLATPPADPLAEGWERFPFNHPLFVLFTSGTTGPPKCIVHGAGGTLLEHLKEHRLHVDLRPEDKLFFHTTAAWMMWNWQLSALACGTQIVVFDGRLKGPGTLWEIVSEEEVTVFGTSPPYLQLCEESGYSPGREAPFRRLRSILSTGSVLRDWQFDWVEEAVGPVRLQSISGGTDIVGCFVLGHPDLPVRRGTIQCRSLGLDVQALATESTPAGSGIGELICRNPFPSRPLGLLGDADGSRFHDAYFAENEGVWTHGDLIELDEKGRARIHGRSDGVLNIHGVRIGPAEIYQALHDVPEIGEAMAVEQQGEKEPRLVLLVVLRDGAVLDGELTMRVRRTIAHHTSALHVPSLVVAVGELPLTHSGKRSERAGRDAVNGRAPANGHALANPGSAEEIARAVALAEEAQREREAVSEDAPTVERLRAIWAIVLGAESLGDDDDFFEVGGTSLLAVRLFHLIAERLGRELPLSTLLEAPTIAELAAAIDDPDRRTGRLVSMRRGSGGPPLFFVHSLWGDVLGMRQLARAIEADIPIYGLRARGLEPDEEPQTSVEEMARTYVEAILAAQPEGPYRVAGHSFGALVAFEVARQLTEAGAEVSWLGLIDGELSTACLPQALRWRYRVALPFHMARAALADPRAAVRALTEEAIPSLWRRSGGRRASPRAAMTEEPPASWMEGVAPHYQRLAGTFLAAAGAFRPRPYPGAVTYFLPEVRRFHLYADPLPAWRRVAKGGLTLKHVPGPHVGMVSGERVPILASQIDECLRDSQAAGAAEAPGPQRVG